MSQAQEKEKSAIQPAVDFILELDKLKGVTRKNKPLGLERYENSAEHSWQLCLLAISLARHAAAPVDLNRVIRMLLVHDIGEIDTGDTMVFIEEGLAARKAAELVAVTRIFNMLPGHMLPGGMLPDHTESDKSGSKNSGLDNSSGDNPGAELLSLWKEFERGETPESRFANAVDRSMPVLLNLSSEGQSWKENGISYERVVKRIEPEIKAGCPALWEYLRVKLEEARGKGYFGA
jgi:putative hydrolase of HD superfamily